MKKILFACAICIPSFAMYPSSYETRLENVETAVTEIKDVLNDKTDSSTGETVPGLKTKVENNITKVNTLEEDMTEIKNLMDYKKDPSTGNSSLGLKSRVDTLSDEEFPELKSRVDELYTTLENEGIPGLKSKVENNITKIDNLTGIVSRISVSITELQTNVEGITTDVNTLQKDIYDYTDPETQEVTPGLKTLVETNIPIIKSLQDEVESISLGIAGLSTAISGLPEIIKNINEKIDQGWDTFLEEKFQEYMEVKKKVLDIIAKCKTNGEPIPTYIVETAEQLQVMDLEMRRLVLSEILTKLKVFESLLDSKNNPILDSNKMESLQTYLDNTTVPKPELKEIQPILSYIIEGEYIKVTGETRKFTRSVGFKTGLPKENWMDQSCDYFSYGFLPVMKNAISSENDKRASSNEAIRKENAKAQASYDAGISAAERVVFPTDNLTTLINDYNRLLLHHEI